MLNVKCFFHVNTDVIHTFQAGIIELISLLWQLLVHLDHKDKQRKQMAFWVRFC